MEAEATYRLFIISLFDAEPHFVVGFVFDSVRFSPAPEQVNLVCRKKPHIVMRLASLSRSAAHTTLR
jgi:hypothetical protein